MDRRADAPELRYGDQRLNVKLLTKGARSYVYDSLTDPRSNPGCMQDPINAARGCPAGSAKFHRVSVPETPLARALALSLALRSMLGIARALVETGRYIDLAGLQNQIGMLCAQALDLEPGEGRIIRVELIELLADLDLLVGIDPPRGCGRD